MSRLRMIAALLAVAILLPVTLLTADPGAPPPAFDGPEGSMQSDVTPAMLVAQAEAAEIRDQFDEALEYRQRAMEGFANRLTVVTAWQAAAADRLQSADADERRLLAAWQTELAAMHAGLTTERDRCAYWVAQLEAEDHGALPNLSNDRRIVWEREGVVLDHLVKVRELEAAGEWADAHYHRRKAVLECKANRRWFGAKHEAMERTQRLIERMRRLRDTDAAAVAQQQVDFYAHVLEWTNATLARLETTADAQQHPAAGLACADMWAALPEHGADWGVRPMPWRETDCDARADIARGRAGWYQIREDQRDEREPREDD